MVIPELIMGKQNLYALNIFSQSEIQATTLQILQLLLKPKWMQTEMNKNLYRQYFTDYKSDSDAIVNKELQNKIAGVSNSMKDYFAYVLLDFALCDSDISEPASAFVLDLAENLQLKKSLTKAMQKELKLLLDTAGVWRDFHSLKTDFTVVVFWDPECGHCKKELPKLAAYYEKIKHKSVSIYAVSSSHDEPWKKFIRDYKLNFINVAVPQEVYTDQFKVNEYVLGGKTDVKSLNYHLTYDIFTTPQIYLLDKDTTIVGKKLDTDLLKQVLETKYKF